MPIKEFCLTKVLAEMELTMDEVHRYVYIFIHIHMFVCVLVSECGCVEECICE
jgi:hypothetical protein